MPKVPVVGLALVASLCAQARAPRPSGEAPRAPARPANWSSGAKQYFGTSYEAYDSRNGYSDASPTAPLSKVWFTGAQNVLTEVFWPTIDRPQVRDSQFLVTDGRSFLFEERLQAQSTVRWLKRGVPAFEIVNQDPQRRFRIERLVYSDPTSPVVLQRVRIVRNVPGLRFYVLHNPSVANSPNKDTGTIVWSDNGEQALVASEGREAQALLTSVRWKQASAGFEGVSDGYHDLSSDFVLDSNFERARDGNVVLTAWLDLPEDEGTTEFLWALGFGETEVEARRRARDSMAKANSLLDRYVGEWQGYQSSVRDLGDASRDFGELFRASVAMLKAMEDKTYAGAFVASPSKPWGQFIEDAGATSLRPNARRLGGNEGRALFPSLLRSRFATNVSTLASGDAAHGLYGGYHLVWSRDLYQMATSFLAIGDKRSAIASLDYLRARQLTASRGEWRYGSRRRSMDGSFSQNMWMDGTPYWGALQMDQVGFPVVLAYRLWRAGHVRPTEIWDLVRRASDFIADFGPWTAQERWEEAMGVSPSTVAAQIAALWSAGSIAEAVGDTARARRYWDTADAWSSKPGDNLEAWTFTTSGKHGNGKYYVRIEAAGSPDQSWDPNDDARIRLSNGGDTLREKDILDGGFLELVRLGVRKALDYHVMETVHEYDRVLKVETRHGPGYFRYTGDLYNYDDENNRQTKGMLWPFLTGERANFELAYRLESGFDRLSAKESLVPYVEAMEGFATPSYMLPEQVWDSGARQGLPTGAATPLGWTHGEYVKLLAARKDVRPDILSLTRSR